jgi:hypothetical protein
MSCITELLKIKGDREYLSHPKNTDSQGVVIEDGGHYKEHEFLITFTGMGYRCGYVAISQDIVNLYDLTEDKVDEEIEAHGSVTFFDNEHCIKDLLSHVCYDFWIGFDAGHSCDRKDLNLLKKIFPGRFSFYKSSEYYNEEGSTIRNLNYMKNECKKVIDQLIDKKWV